MKKEPGHIREILYKKILEVMPIPCVDAVITHKGKFLLVKRLNKPAQGEWWLVGGRVLKRETLKIAIRRKIKEEIGLRKIKIKKFLTTKDTIFSDGIHDASTHTINSIFLVEAKNIKALVPDISISELKWFSRIQNNWPIYVKDVLKVAGFST